MKPTSITLEQTKTHIQLRVTATETAKGSVVIEGTPFSGSAPKPQTIIRLRKCGARYAKRFGIPFVDQTEA